MKDRIQRLTCEVELQLGERLSLPQSLIESVGAGRWVITVEPADQREAPIRSHGAFLNGYAAEDEGLYDDCSGR